MIGLTSKQARVLAFVQEGYRRTGKEPHYREIAEHMGVTVRAAAQHIEALEKKGYVNRDRGIVLSEENRPPRGIPLLGRVAAGSPILADENVEQYLDPDDLFGAYTEQKVFALRVRGDSMTGAGILDGDLLLVRSTRKASDGDVVVAIVGEEATVKFYRRKRSRTLLEAASEGHDPIDVTGREDVRIAGSVMACHRRM